ncbi:OmpA/MotB family protein [Desulfovibrio ferrophilus]|uniref:Flagellar motor protein n=1 Tax=Desulfovibrio ferrophilus TaxID=241368 RepID=A0A2Z6AZK1_9BACT|nr:flagellar motor protein MotB [Desulfovibrio ferrophilus]BBD08701.1 flagellar motor protein [Desulfovibrio ferrophilus]
MPGPVKFKRTEREQGGAWELSFADMMTLILCFFILMVTVSEVNREQYEVVAESLGEAMGTKAPEPEAPMIPAEWRQRLKSMEDVRHEITARTRHASDALSLEMRPNAVAVNLRGAVFFELGSAELTPTALEILADIAPPLMGIPYRMTVEGHTDNIPIKSSAFPSNWELSAARASAVARYFIDHGFPRDHVQVMGLADTRPKRPNMDIHGNAIAENQAQNRRIVILVEPME